MYDFQVVPSERNTSHALRCQFERPNLDIYTRACISRDGNSPVMCIFPNTEDLSVIQSLTRGWGSSRDVEYSTEGYIMRIHYVWRREQTSEEGYFSCHNFGRDNNDPVGFYILYPSEWPSLVIV